MNPTVGTPLPLRLGISVVVAGLIVFTIAYAEKLGHRGQSALGFLCFLGTAAAFSNNLQRVKLKTLFWGILLQFSLAYAVLKFDDVRRVFEVVGEGIKTLIACSDVGADFVFGSLSKPGGPSGFVFAFKALPPIIFISSFFSVLYYLGVLQLIVRFFAFLMRYVMGTSGAETLSVSANVFMGQTEAPLIVKPFIPRMTKSELLTLMASGMAHISGGMMAVYISYGADPVSILCTCIIACPCSLYLSKLVMPEIDTPETSDGADIKVPRTHANAIDAAAGGVKDGLFLAMNVAAMLIAFLAFIALFDAIIGSIWPEWSIQKIMGILFQPVAILMGIEPSESERVGSLLGIKLAANEHVAYVKFTKDAVLGMNPTMKLGMGAGMGVVGAAIQDTVCLSQRSQLLTVYALSGFANFASIGIQLGGIGAMAEGRRSDLAKLGLKALFVGYMVTLINAAVAGMIMEPKPVQYFFNP
ncbi:Na+ dependent nucleoside transporter domain protein [Telmatocola sphagniphila]|uniref:Na+ dependent nucleoside transporter domain protein n=1 Tax=Telmatocola sphagniphila TaxID=1123043 RepID=A0A8E6F0C2_9BACT|nr:nucleoside transporter C-terminal domain-containing protein [Telmatocola sphagniphila]QVL34643.1 Na+ dependent nucleoside transporter domain protein [Telmatocola sphagniphila]